MVVLIVDYKTSNLGSITRAVQMCGQQVIVSDNPSDLKKADKIILPGIGVFADAMSKLTKSGWIESLQQEVIHNKKYFLGICLGMQLLADIGYEGGSSLGLGFIPGSVKKIQQKNAHERVPHVGWNEVYTTKRSPVFYNIADGADFYFVHSYTFTPTNPDHILATTPYADGIVSAVNTDHIFGLQFHPEKSAPAGFEILKNFLKL